MLAVAMATGTWLESGVNVAQGQCELTRITGADNVPGDWFGYAVDMSGDTVMVGATSSFFGWDGKGSAHIFTPDSSQVPVAIATATQAGFLRTTEQ